MTLHLHRSELIPTIDYSGAGKLLVTDNDGTFPLRGGKKRNALPTYGNENDAFNDNEEIDRVTYRSYDPQRDAQKRKYMRNNSMVNDNGTISTLSSRGKLKRRSKNIEKEKRFSSNISNGSNSTIQRKVKKRLKEKECDSTNGSISTISTGNYSVRRRGQLPSLQNTLKTRRSQNLVDLKMAKQKKDDEEIERILRELGAKPIKRTSGKLPFIDTLPKLDKKITDERPLWLPMIIWSIFILLFAILNAIFNPWHHYYCLFWTFIFIFLFGLFGKWHAGDYLTHTKNILYICFGFFSTLCCFVSCGLILYSFSPIIVRLISNSTTTIEQLSSEFTYHEKVVLSVSNRNVLWLSIAIDVGSLIFSMICFYCLTSALICFSNYWDASFWATAICNHRGTPNLFNPMQQVSFGSCIHMFGVLLLSLNSSERDHYFSAIWPAPIIIFSSFICVAAAKRPDRNLWNTLSVFFQILCLIVTTFSAVITVLILYDNTTELRKGISNKDSKQLTKIQKDKLIASIISGALFLFMCTITIVFLVGVAFRQIRISCCRNMCIRNTAEANRSLGPVRQVSGTYA